MLRILKDERGFTLIELVIIIILIAVLAGVAIPRFVNLRGEAITAKAKAMQDAGMAAITLNFAEEVLTSTYASDLTCGSPPCDVSSPSANLDQIHSLMEVTPSYPPNGPYGDPSGSPTGFYWVIAGVGDANTPARIYGMYDGAEVDSL